MVIRSLGRGVLGFLSMGMMVALLWLFAEVIYLLIYLSRMESVVIVGVSGCEIGPCCGGGQRVGGMELVDGVTGDGVRSLGLDASW